MLNNLGSRSLDELVAETRRLYARADQKRLAWDLWFHTCHHAAELARTLRTCGTAEEWKQELADTTLWLFTLIARAAGARLSGRTQGPPSLDSVIRISGGCSDLLWLRYPGVCPSCLKRLSERATVADEPVACSCEGHVVDQLKPEEHKDLEQPL